MSEGRSVIVLFFAAARDAARVSEARFEIEEDETVASLRRKVFARFEGLRGWERAVRFAVDGEYASDDRAVRAGAEVALIPPVAGG